MEQPSKIRSINGENAESLIRRLLSAAASSPGAAPSMPAIPAAELRKFAIKLLKALCDDSSEGDRLRASVRQIISAGEHILAIVKPQGE